jgi:hypothetical protein
MLDQKADYQTRTKNFEDLYTRAVDRSVKQVQAFHAKKSDLQNDLDLSAAARTRAIRQLQETGGGRDQAIQALADTHDQAVNTLSILINDHKKITAKAINAWDTGKLNTEKTYYQGRIKELVNRADPNPGRTLAREAQASGDPHKMRALSEALAGSSLKDITSLVDDLSEKAIKTLPDADTSEANQALSEALFSYGRMRSALSGAYQSVYFGNPDPGDPLGRSLARRKIERNPDGGLVSMAFLDQDGQEQARVDYQQD